MDHPDGGEVSVEEYRVIEYDRPHDGVARITMNRPDMRNAQDPRMLAELDAAFGDADRDDKIDCIVFAGAGSDFSSGHDLSDEWEDPLNQAFWDQWEESIEDRTRVEREFFYDHALRIRDLDTPTVASVQGNCVLAGIMLANACDLIVASEDAKFVNPSMRHVGTGAEVLMLPWVIGPRKTKELLWTGDPLYAEDAADLGLVNRVVPREDLDDETMYLARRVALNPTISLQVTKDAINNALDEMGQRQALKYHFALHQIVHSSAESDEWHEEAAEIQAEGGFGAWLEFRDGPFRDLAEEYGKEDPHVS